MKPRPPGVMTPNKYLQTDEQTLLEIALHWRLMQVFPREPRRIGYDADGKRQNSMKAAHRVSYELFNGGIPDGLFVLHKCDTPGCVNPEHLFLGTNLDNVRDMDAKGRRVNTPKYGSDHGNAVLDEKQVLEIMELLKARKPTQKEIAEMYGVSFATINHIKTGRLWAHVTGVKREKN